MTFRFRAVFKILVLAFGVPALGMVLLFLMEVLVGTPVSTQTRWSIAALGCVIGFSVASLVAFGEVAK